MPVKKFRSPQDELTVRLLYLKLTNIRCFFRIPVDRHKAEKVNFSLGNVLFGLIAVKRFLKIALLICVLSSRAFSQILVGPVVGGNYSWTSFADKDLRDTYKVGGVFGYHAGAQLSFKVRKRFFLHSALIYSTKGRNMKSTEDAQFEYKTQYTFIEMPVAYAVDFKARLGNSKEFKYFFGLGPNISYWLGGKGTLANSDLKEEHIDKLLYKIVYGGVTSDAAADTEMVVERPNKLQLGLNVVAGLVFEPADRQRVMVTLRYELGHTYLGKSDGVIANTYFKDPLQSTNQGIRLSIAYLYDLKTDDRNKGKSTIDRRHPR